MDANAVASLAAQRTMEALEAVCLRQKRGMGVV